MKNSYTGWLWNCRWRLTLCKEKIKLRLKGQILNPLWLTSNQRKQRFLAAVMDYTEENLKVSLPDISSFKAASIDHPGSEPERAFTIWLQGEESAPDIVKSCFFQMRKILNMEVVVLDKETIFDWITLPAYVVEAWKSGRMRAAHFTDICRVELLYQHGGIWLDSTDYVVSTVPKDIMMADFFVYMAGKKVGGSIGFIQNCFIRAKKGNPLLGLWREAILKQWERVPIAVAYFQHQRMFKKLVHENAYAAALFQQMHKIDQDPTHFLWYGHGNEPYDEPRYKELASVAFFTKTSHDSKMTNSPLRGSIAEHMILQYKEESKKNLNREL